MGEKIYIKKQIPEWVSAVQLINFDFRPHRHWMHPKSKGLSHGLKIARQLSIFAPVYGLVPPFRVPWRIKKPDTQMGIWFFGTPKGTRTPDLLIRSQSLYPTELSAHVRSTRLAIIAQLFRKCKHYFRFFCTFFKNVVLLQNTTFSISSSSNMNKSRHPKRGGGKLILFSRPPQDPFSQRCGKESYPQSASAPH